MDVKRMNIETNEGGRVIALSGTATVRDIRKHDLFIASGMGGRK